MLESFCRHVAGLKTAFLAVGAFLAFYILPEGLVAASISGLSPALGHPGDVVQINGSGFDPTAANNLVRFGPNRAAVLSATPTQLSVQVPDGQPLGPAPVNLNGVNGPTFFTTTNAKLTVPPNPTSDCCQYCAGQDSNSSPCVSLGSHLGGALGGSLGGGNGNIYGERGEFFQYFTDIIIPGRPGAAAILQFTVRRQYRAAAINNGPLGNKWDQNYFERLELQIDGSIIHANGLGRNDRYLLNNKGMFVAPPEFYTTLVRNGNASYTLTYKDQTVKQFDKNGKIQQISDRNGNSLSFSYDGLGKLITVTDTLGRDNTYSYNPSGNLQSITDFNGRTISYTYSANGDLASVTSPPVTGTPNGNDFPAGKTTRYTYDSNHLLLTVTRPNETASAGSPVVQNTYDSNGRVVAQLYGGANASGVPAGGTYSYTYTPMNSGVTSADPNLPVMRTQQTDRNGNVRQYDYNRLGYPLAIREYTHGVRPSDPAFYTTTFAYNADGRLLQTTMPQGNVTQYVYDEGNPNRLQQGNVLQEIRTPDAARGGDQHFITTTYTYEPVFNHAITMTDARGNDPSFVPPNGGAPSPARYTTRYFYDANGNLVQSQRPTVTLPNSTQQQIVTDYTYNQFGQMTSETDPEGNVTQYSYYAMNDPGNTTGGYLKQRVVDAGASPRRTETAPPAQITTQYFYDAVGNPVRVIDPRGNDTLFAYNQLNQVAQSQSEAPFRYTAYTFYDANDNVIQHNLENRVVAETGGKPSFTGDGNFSAQAGTPSFFIDRYAYDILDNMVTRDLDATGSNPSRVVTQYRYDPNENRIRETLPAGNVTTAQYDERDLLFTKTRGFGSSSASTATFAYDLNRNLAQMADDRGLATNYQYDGFDRSSLIIDAAGGQMVTHRDPVGNIVGTSLLGQPGGPTPTNNSGAGNVLLNQRTYEYDELSRRYQYDEKPVNGNSFVAAGVTTQRPPSITPGPLNPGSISTQSIYDRDGRVTQTIGDDLAITSMQYDGANRRVMVTDPQANTIQYTYDGNSNVTQMVERDVSQKGGVASENFTTTYQYDSRNRQTSVSDNCRNTRRTAYDSRNNATDMTDAKTDDTAGCPGVANAQGNSFRYTYDGLSRRLQAVQDLRAGGVGSGPIDTTNPFNPSGQIVTTNTYDADSRMIALTDSNGNTTQYTYDALNRKLTAMMADGASTTYSYDADDNLIVLTDNNGTVQRHSYDNLNRRSQTAVTPAVGVIGTTLNAYQYDGLSRTTQMMDNNDPSDPASASTVNLGYDSLGRIVEDNRNGKAVDSAWTAEARRTGLIYPNNRQLSFSYDSLERIQTIQDMGAPANLAQYSYIGRARVLQRLYQNGTQLTYLDNGGTTDIGYDPLRRTVQRRDLNGSNALLAGFTYGYDREDNKNGEAKLHATASSESYKYDSAYRLTDFARGQLNMIPSSTQDWTLDGVGGWRVNSINGILQTRAVNSTNEYTEIVTAGASTDSETYDNNGNLIFSTGQALSYQWDYRNRLRKVCKLTGTATNCAAPGASLVDSYNYDGINRRTQKVVTNSGSLNGTTSFYYDGWQTIEERDGSDSLTQQYVNGIYPDEALVLDRAGGQRYFYHQNTLNSTAALTDANGNVVEGYQYDAYGQQTVLAPDFTTVVGTVSGFGNPFMFTGQRFDPETGLIFYKNRYYSASLGRFISRDPIGYLGGSNLYEYVSSSPTNWTDSSGLAKEICCKYGGPGQGPTVYYKTTASGCFTDQWSGQVGMQFCCGGGGPGAKAPPGPGPKGPKDGGGIVPPRPPPPRPPPPPPPPPRPVTKRYKLCQGFWGPHKEEISEEEHQERQGVQERVEEKWGRVFHGRSSAELKEEGAYVAARGDWGYKAFGLSVLAGAAVCMGVNAGGSWEAFDEWAAEQKAKEAAQKWLKDLIEKVTNSEPSDPLDLFPKDFPKLPDPPALPGLNPAPKR